MSTLKLDLLSGDLAVENGSLVLLNATGSEFAEETAQRLKTKFQFFLGEWHLDTRAGMPHYQKVLKKNPDLTVITALFREAILNDEGVAELVSLKLDLVVRTLSVAFEAVLSSGEVLEFEDFILGENL